VATGVISDLSGRLVQERVRLVVKQHPDLEQAVVLDMDESEADGIKGSAGNFVVVELVRDGEAPVSMVLELKAFNGLFKGDPIDALESAPKANGLLSGAAKRDPNYLQAVREWGRANGWPELSDRGRVPAAVEKAYGQAVA